MHSILLIFDRFFSSFSFLLYRTQISEYEIENNSIGNYGNGFWFSKIILNMWK